MATKQFTTKNIICSNYCVWDNNDKPYGNDEVVELLNELYKEKEQLKKENKELKQSIRVIYDLIDGYIAIADKYRKPIKSLTLGDDLGYWNGVYQYMKKLRERIWVL